MEKDRFCKSVDISSMDAVDALLATLDKKQLVAFIKKECSGDVQLRERLLSLGVGVLNIPRAEYYTKRVKSLIDYISDGTEYVPYAETSDLNQAIFDILEEADKAIKSERWEVARAVLVGVSAVSEDIMNCGDDSNGYLGEIVDECFIKLEELCANKSLPDKLRSEMYELALTRFNAQNLKGWDWWWSWMEIAISLADTPEKRQCLIEALDRVINSEDDEWNDTVPKSVSTNQ